jgi:transposase
VSQGLFFTTPPKRPVGQRGRARASPERNLVERFRDHKDSILCFLRDFNVPFDNNLSERDLRMAKVKQKVSGCLTSAGEQGVHIFAAVRGYVSTVRKQGYRALAALRGLFDGQPVKLRLA